MTEIARMAEFEVDRDQEVALPSLQRALATDMNARRPGPAEPIEGLYARSSDMALLMNRTCPGPGTTSQRALVDAHREALHFRASGSAAIQPRR